MNSRSRAPKGVDELKTLMAIHLSELGFSRIGDRGTRLDPGYFGMEFLFAWSAKHWRFDAALRTERTYDDRGYGFDKHIAIEAEGLVRSGRGGHQTVKGFTANCEKYNEAILQGWMLLRFPVSQIRDGSYLKTVKRAIGGHNDTR